MTVLQCIEYLGVITALLYLLLATKRLWIAWPFYIASSVFYLPVFWIATLYADAALQLYFIAVGIYGWKNWRAEAVDAVTTVSLPARQHVVILTGGAATIWILGSFLSRSAAGVYGYPDAFITVGSIVTSVLTARRVVEGWIYWIVINLVAVVVFSLKGLDPMTIALYGLYVVLSIRALLLWKSAQRL